MSGCLSRDAETVSFDEFEQFVMPVVHNAPFDLVVGFCRRAAIDLCERAPVLKDTLTSDVQAGVADYALDWDSDQLTIRGVSQVHLGEIELHCLDKRPVKYSGVKQGFWFEPPRELIVSPAPPLDEDGWLVVEAIAKPLPTADTLPRILYDQYGEIIGDGALSRLLLMKTADWYDPQAAGIYLKRFRGAVAQVRTGLTRGLSTGPMIARAPRWA